MNFYIGTKQIQAEPMMEHDFAEEQGRPAAKFNREGYRVVYSHGYVSWSPTDVFEAAYFALESEDGSTITQADVENFVAEWESVKHGQKTTVVTATLRNGFEIVESSSCVDAKNYNHDMGVENCKKRIYDKVWMLLGFLLQSARNGVG